MWGRRTSQTVYSAVRSTIAIRAVVMRCAVAIDCGCTVAIDSAISIGMRLHGVQSEETLFKREKHLLLVI